MKRIDLATWTDHECVIERTIFAKAIMATVVIAAAPARFAKKVSA